MARFYLKYRDTRPTIEVALTDPDGTAHDLTGADSVTLHIWLRGSSSTVISRTMTINADPATGLVTYTWLATDWDTGKLVLGTHRMEYEVKGPGTERLSFPNDTYDKLLIVTDLGQTV